ncbi:MAG: single-stranded-DNA-specific exonuclease RecJ [Alphaproteobacteria bacterium]|nr:single-stranded-DNA-specific exonuclease RecJ [Alphaproteobacteria bacterium]
MSENLAKNISIGGNLWQVATVDERHAELLAQRFNLPFIMAKIMALRGISVDEVEKFLSPKINNLMPDPYVLKDMQKAAERIAQAIINKERIAIIGDYDVDGATSTSVMKLFLRSVGVEPDVHIPDRDEGYGPSKQAIDNFALSGCGLLMTLDCGTTAFEPLEYAVEKGFDVIVLDHHEAEIKLPKIYAVVNPKRLDESDDYPSLKYMAAVGVVFMTVVAVNRCLREKGFYKDEIKEPDLKKWLDLVALGTVCDVVQLKGINRAYVAQGLKVMAQRGNIGLTVLMDKANLSEAPTAFHLGYVLGPRINACGRVGDADMGNQLLCCDNDYQAQLLVDKLNEFNITRKDIENHVLLSAIEQVEGSPQEYPIAFVYGNDWHQGVIGIVAGRLKERYNVPSFVMSIEPDEVKGSARSIPQVDLGALVIAAKERGILTKGGGHTMAAGFSLEEAKIEEFKKFVGEYVSNKIDGEEVTPVIEIDSVLDVGGANIDLADYLEKLEPYGAGNSEPKLMLKKVNIIKPVLFGVGHVRCVLTSQNGGNIKGIAFRVGDNQIGHTMLNAKKDFFDVVGVLRHDKWNGRNDVQFIIEDIRKVCDE